MEKKTVFELAHDEMRRFTNERAIHRKRMLDLFPEHSVWGCSFGTRNGQGSYNVRIISYYDGRGFTVENVKTGSMKTVSLSSLHEAPDDPA